MGTQHPARQASVPAPALRCSSDISCPEGAWPPARHHSPARCPGGRGYPPSPSPGSAAGSGPGLPHSLRTGAAGQSPCHLLHPPPPGRSLEALGGNSPSVLIWHQAGLSSHAYNFPKNNPERGHRQPQTPGHRRAESSPAVGPGPPSHSHSQAWPRVNTPQNPPAACPPLTHSTPLQPGGNPSRLSPSQPPASALGPHDAPGLTGRHQDSGRPAAQRPVLLPGSASAVSQDSLERHRGRNTLPVAGKDHCACCSETGHPWRSACQRALSAEGGPRGHCAHSHPRAREEAPAFQPNSQGAPQRPSYSLEPRAH